MRRTLSTELNNEEILIIKGGSYGYGYILNTKTDQCLTSFAITSDRELKHNGCNNQIAQYGHNSAVFICYDSQDKPVLVKYVKGTESFTILSDFEQLI